MNDPDAEIIPYDAHHLYKTDGDALRDSKNPFDPFHLLNHRMK
jgi:hypothetical protein